MGQVIHLSKGTEKRGTQIAGTALFLVYAKKDLTYNLKRDGKPGKGKWPTSGKAFYEGDWVPDINEDGGFTGRLWGAVSIGYRAFDTEEYTWLVVACALGSTVKARFKEMYKFRECEVLFCGDYDKATQFILDRAPKGTPVINQSRIGGNRAELTVGNSSSALVGDYGTATSGDIGLSSAGVGGTSSVGSHGTALAGDKGTANAGVGGKAIVGEHGTANVKSFGEAIADDFGTANAGDSGMAISGAHGTSVVGSSGTAFTKKGGFASAGKGGNIILTYLDDKCDYRHITFKVGDPGIEPNVLYGFDHYGNVIRKDTKQVITKVDNYLKTKAELEEEAAKKAAAKAAEEAAAKKAAPKEDPKDLAQEKREADRVREEFLEDYRQDALVSFPIGLALIFWVLAHYFAK